jgi:signal peptidase I
MPRLPRRSRRLSRALTVLAVLLVGLLAVRTFVAEPLRIRTASMAPTLVAGQHVVADKVTRRHGGWERGDVVAFRRGSNGDMLVKRIVGLPGEVVELRDGRLFLDGKPLTETYADPQLIDSVYFGPVRVPEAHVFLLGDNRADSEDSRAFGAVPTESLRARVDTVIWPLPPTRTGLGS